MELTPLSTCSNEELVKEITSRFDVCVFMGTMTERDPVNVEDQVTMAASGQSFAVLGMAHELIRRLTAEMESLEFE